MSSNKLRLNSLNNPTQYLHLTETLRKAAGFQHQRAVLSMDCWRKRGAAARICVSSPHRGPRLHRLRLERQSTASLICGRNSATQPACQTKLSTLGAASWPDILSCSWPWKCKSILLDCPIASWVVRPRCQPCVVRKGLARASGAAEANLLDGVTSVGWLRAHPLFPCALALQLLSAEVIPEAREKKVSCSSSATLVDIGTLHI